MKLSIIMPCFNVERTLARALDSIFMQRVSFDYEVIIVNDASTDATISIIEQYRAEHSEIKVINNPINCGNARSFYNGLCVAQGDYFCVLDGDDYYTVCDKLSRQVSFLDHDYNEEYVATATYHVRVFADGTVYVQPRNGKTEFSYVDLLTNNAGYYHTATYMYRNIFRGNVPEFYKQEQYRGDTPRTTFHLIFSNRKVRVLDFVGSAYTFENNGIWSAMTQKQQNRHMVKHLKTHKCNVQTKFEKDSIDMQIRHYEINALKAKDEIWVPSSAKTIDECMKKIRTYVNKFAFEYLDFMLNGLYTSQYLDSLIASLGYVKRIYNKFPQKAVNYDAVCITIGVMKSGGGGIYPEILQLIDLYADKNVYLFITNTTDIPEETIQLTRIHKNLTLVYAEPGELDRLGFFISHFVEISPYRAYYYCSHNDVYGIAMMKSGLGCENITLFSFDHGYICGILNPNLDTIIAKRPVDYYLLKRYFGEKVKYIPAWENSPRNCADLTYKPFAGHDTLITASGAARFYKVDTNFPFSYVEFITQFLKRTDSVHYHYGPIPEEKLEAIYKKMTLLGISHSRFVHVPWAANMPRDLLEKHIDVFIEPFPVVSYKMTLGVMSVGIPVICWDGIKRTSIADFVPSEMPKWRNLPEFITIMCSLNKDRLSFLSNLSKSYFEEHFSTKVVMPALIDNQSLPAPPKYPCSDDVIQDISSCFKMFGTSFQINIT